MPATVKERCGSLGRIISNVNFFFFLHVYFISPLNTPNYPFKWRSLQQSLLPFSQKELTTDNVMCFIAFNVWTSGQKLPQESQTLLKTVHHVKWQRQVLPPTSRQVNWLRSQVQYSRIQGVNWISGPVNQTWGLYSEGNADQIRARD